MKIREIESQLVINEPGSVKIIAEEQDDFWILYHLMAAGDIITAVTTRKVLAPNGDPTRVRFLIELRIVDIDYDRDSCMMRLKGKALFGNDYIAEGAFHTIEIEKNKPFDLSKKSWDKTAIETLRDGCKRPVGADLAVLLIKEGVAELYLVGKSVSNMCARVEGSKGKGNKVVDSEELKIMFFESVLKVFMKHVDFGVIRCVMIGGPNAVKEQYRQYIMCESKRLRLKSILDNKSRIVVIDVGLVSKAGLSEALQNPVVMNVVKGAKCGMEVRAMKDFNDMILSDSDWACYGPKSVDIASELAAIETLLITDELYRNADIGIRGKYAELVDSVKRTGGKVMVLSSMHVFGEQLNQLTGVAAILRFPMPNIEELEL